MRRVTLVHLVPHADLRPHPHLSTMADVEMKPVDEKKEEKKEEKPAEEKKSAPLTPVAEIKGNVALIERAVSTLEPRFTHRVLRSLTHLRKKLNDKVLQDAVHEVYRIGAYGLFSCHTPLALRTDMYPSPRRATRRTCDAMRYMACNYCLAECYEMSVSARFVQSRPTRDSVGRRPGTSFHHTWVTSHDVGIY